MLNPTMKETEVVDKTVLLIEKCDIQFTQLNQKQDIYIQKSPNRLSIKH